MVFAGEIRIERSFFSEKPKELASIYSFKAHTFIYNSGVYGIKLENKKGYITVLPYMGQMVWDVVFGDRNLAMNTTFSQPVPVDFFLYTYGAFMIHCGALRMGCPGPEDTHPLHGELPCAEYKNVKVLIGEDKKGKFIGITGVFEYNIAFGAHYLAIPLVKVYENSTILEISINIENISNYPMELMYMAHVNLRPVVGGRITQSLGWSKDDLVIRDSIPSHISVPEGYREFIAKLKEDPGLTRIIKSEDVYRPEVVFFLNKPKTDENGFTHFMHIHPDGSSDYVSYKPEEMDHAARWFCINEDKQALGLVLPSTADAEGYTLEKKKGNIKIIEGKNSRSFTILTGYLDKEETISKEKYISGLIDS